MDFWFKFDPALFSRGAVAFDWALQGVVGLSLLGALAVVVLGVRAARADPNHRSDLGWCMSLRAAAVALLLALLLRPVLVVDIAEPIRSMVGLLVDDSSSMRIQDYGGRARSEFLRTALAPETDSTLAALESNFDTKLFKFHAEALPIASVDELSFNGNSSKLGTAFKTLLRQFDDAAPAALVLFSDGADSGSAVELEHNLLSLRRRGVPVYTILSAPREPPPDLELSGLRLPAKVLRGDRVEARVLVRHHSLAGQQARLRVEHQGALLHETVFELPSDGDTRVEIVPLAFDQTGRLELDFHVNLVASESPEQGAPQELLLHNNSDQVLVEVEDRAISVLHFEGEPRFEVKFLRRAVFDDPAIRLVSLIRTAENKHYRLGINNADELRGGFPDNAADLFAFDAIVLGSVSAAELTPAQQKLLADFVLKRGGGLVALGGQRALDRGGFAGGRLADLLPLVLPPKPPQRQASDFHVLAKVQPTQAGLHHPLTQLGTTGEASPWARLPPLSVVNPLTKLKPGATLLLRGEPQDEANRNSAEPLAPLAILAVQRYGRGRVAALPVRDTWRWQINQDVSPDDMTHETFWRQLLRWLAGPARRRIEIKVLTAQDHLAADQPASSAMRPTGAQRAAELTHSQAPAGERITVEAVFLNANFEPTKPTTASLIVTTPLGDREQHNLTWSGDETGAYQANFETSLAGAYELEVTAQVVEANVKDKHASEPVPDPSEANRPAPAEPAPTSLRAYASLLTTANGRESFGANRGQPLLEYISKRTGGRFFHADEVASEPDVLAAVIKNLGRSRLREQRLPLWDAPFLLALLLLLVCGEWLIRRARKLR